jgi:glycosyltransferase involved in cell wall biosynthesis
VICPTLDEFHPPPLGRSGWPWTEESSRLPNTMPDSGFGLGKEDSPWPRLSIVTPSFNQAQFIEETIRSVLLQGYPNLEYIIIDGGSTDGSVEIIRKYDRWLTYWVSEPDEGQSDALCKGFQRATGAIVAWINSDDSYLPGVFADPIEILTQNPDVVLVYGDCDRVDEHGHIINTWISKQVSDSDLLLGPNHIPQQSTFFRAETFTAIGGIDPDLHYVMDYTLWLRLGVVGKIKYLPGVVANFRKHGTSKGLVSGYVFIREKINWLTKWVDLENSLSPSQQLEMYRRKHITAALYAILEGIEDVAVEHFNAAFTERVYPHGDVNTLTLKIVYFGGMDGAQITDSWDRFDLLMRSIRRIKPASIRQLLYRRVASRFHLEFAIRAVESKNLLIARKYLIRVLWYEPRQLKNPIFLRHAMRAFGI